MRYTVQFHPSSLGGWKMAAVKALRKKEESRILLAVMQLLGILEVQVVPRKGNLA